MGGNMRLRNKKTGEVFIMIDHIFDNYTSLAEFIEEWEDCKPAEPLIKDEKVRKAVRAWADAVGLTGDSIVFLDGPDGDKSISRLKAYNNPYTAVIEFGYKIGGYEIEHYKDYTIAELCGEEEE